MNREYTLVYTEQILRKALVEYFKMLSGVGFPILYFLLLGLAIFKISVGDRSWEIGALGAILLFVGFILFYVFIAHLRMVKDNFKKLNTGISTMTILEHSLRFNSPLGLAEIPWSNITKIRCFDDFIMLEMGKRGYTSIPKHSIDNEGIECLKNAIKSAGGIVA